MNLDPKSHISCMFGTPSGPPAAGPPTGGIPAPGAPPPIICPILGPKLYYVKYQLVHGTIMLLEGILKQSKQLSETSLFNLHLLHVGVREHGGCHIHQGRVVKEAAQVKATRSSHTREHRWHPTHS